MDNQGIGVQFLVVATSRSSQEYNQTPIQWGPGALSQGVKWPGREADHSHQYIAEIKNGGAIPPLLRTSSWLSASLIKHRDTFIFTLQIFANDRLLAYFPKLGVYLLPVCVSMCLPLSTLNA
jgi:hypothetical protein